MTTVVQPDHGSTPSVLYPFFKIHPIISPLLNRWYTEIKVISTCIFYISGIQTTTLYWPGKIKQLNRSVIFQLQLWDAGETALKKFDHILSVSSGRKKCLFYLTVLEIP